MPGWITVYHHKRHKGRYVGIWPNEDRTGYVICEAKPKGRGYNQGKQLVEEKIFRFSRADELAKQLADIEVPWPVKPAVLVEATA